MDFILWTTEILCKYLINASLHLILPPLRLSIGHVLMYSVVRLVSLIRPCHREGPVQNVSFEGVDPEQIQSGSRHVKAANGKVLDSSYVNIPKIDATCTLLDATWIRPSGPCHVKGRELWKQ
jgi:hypothetical protein